MKIPTLQSLQTDLCKEITQFYDVLMTYSTILCRLCIPYRGAKQSAKSGLCRLLCITIVSAKRAKSVEVEQP